MGCMRGHPLAQTDVVACCHGVLGVVAGAATGPRVFDCVANVVVDPIDPAIKQGFSSGAVLEGVVRRTSAVSAVLSYKFLKHVSGKPPSEPPSRSHTAVRGIQAVDGGSRRSPGDKSRTLAQRFPPQAPAASGGAPLHRPREYANARSAGAGAREHHLLPRRGVNADA